MSLAALAALLLAVPALARAADAPATVVCKDGTTSKGGKGACSGHGGVDKSAAKAEAKPAPSTPPAASQAQAPSPAPQARSGGSTHASPPAKAKNTDPTGAIARCKDGTYSHAKGHSGACSSHGGVAEWMDQPPAK
jgi:hypothetical protein